MLDFSWNQWLNAVAEFTGMNKARKPRRARTARIEVLEDRALLTANLPVAVNDVYSVNENTTLTGISVLSNDTDLDGDTIDQAALQSTTAHGTLTLASNGTFTYVPNAGFTGTDSFTYLAVDSLHAEASLLPGIVTIHVGTINDAPVALPETVSATTNAAFHGMLSGTDLNGDPLTFSTGASAATNGSVTINPDGAFVFTPTAGFTGVASFSFKVNDGTTSSADAIVTLNVGAAGSNVAPVTTPVILQTATNTAAHGTLTATDANGNPLTFAAGTTAATNGTVVINPDGSFTFTPTAGFTGVGTFSFQASDGTLTSANTTATVHVGVADALPVVTPVTVSTNTNVAFHGKLTATDANGDPLTFSAGTTAATNGTVVINPDGSFVFTPTAGFTGVGTFSYEASDGITNSLSAPVTVNIGAGLNVAPIGTPATLSTAASTALTGNLTATDANGNALTFSPGATAAAHGTVVINPDGSFTYTPTAGFTGTDKFSFIANDGSLNSADTLVTLHVGIANSLPVATPVTFSTTSGTALDGTLTATDANGDPLTFSAGSTAATNGTVVINPDGSFVFTPTAGFTGTGTFSFKASDSIGNSADAIATVNIAPTINVTPVGIATTISTAVDTPFSGTLQATGASGDTLTFSAGAIAAAHGTVVINSDGSFTYTPAAGFTGTDKFTFKASDGSLTSADATVAVHVGVTNALPVVAPITLTTNTNTAVHGTLTATDANGDPLTFSVGTTAATHGTVSVNPDGTFTFTPTAGFTGVATFSYRASDALGSSANATATINVGAGTNVAPIATAATISTAVGTAFNGTLAATDANGDTLTFAAGTTAAAHGTVTINPNGSFTYTPNAGFTGTDSFSFTASDASLTSANSLVTVHVGQTNSLPVVAPITLSTSTGTALHGTLTGTDANGDPLTFSAGTATATNGTVVINPDGTFVFTPTAGFTGVGTFSFKANDGIGSSGDATATVNITPSVSVTPIGLTQTISTAVNTTFSGTLHATGTSGDTLTFAAGTVAAAHGTVVIHPDGTFTYTPAAGFTGTDSFSFKASDGALTSANTLVTVHVGVSNSLPVVAPVTLSTAANTALNGTLTATDAN
ncbi:MAG: outer rane adhesin like protein, partial [Planctomycetaceae bacterium]|nr:outer rane adhesin like protein [Planctomycetaceae bacterium]